jgi:hypothetical protein
MKLSLNFAAVLMCITFSITIAHAQSNKKSIVGIWELAQSNFADKPLVPSRPGLLKIFNSNGTFTNIQARSTGAIISHSGKYRVNNDEFYTETSLSKGDGFIYVTANKPVQINYKFSEDKKRLTLNFTVPEGTSFTEVWRKL